MIGGRINRRRQLPKSMSLRRGRNVKKKPGLTVIDEESAENSDSGSSSSSSSQRSDSSSKTEKKEQKPVSAEQTQVIKKSSKIPEA